MAAIFFFEDQWEALTKVHPASKKQPNLAGKCKNGGKRHKYLLFFPQQKKRKTSNYCIEQKTRQCT
jgi:hypothetical protein